MWVALLKKIIKNNGEGSLNFRSPKYKGCITILGIEGYSKLFYKIIIGKLDFQHVCFWLLLHLHPILLCFCGTNISTRRSTQRAVPKTRGPAYARVFRSETQSQGLKASVVKTQQASRARGSRGSALSLLRGTLTGLTSQYKNVGDRRSCLPSIW